MATVPQSRRRFLATLTGICASAVMLWRFLTPTVTRQRTVMVRAAVDDIPAGGALVFREQRVALLRDGDVLYALELLCTHLGCTVMVNSEGMDCPCHGSRFDRRGEVVKGPAGRPLKRLRVEVRDGVAEVVQGGVH